MKDTFKRKTIITRPEYETVRIEKHEFTFIVGFIVGALITFACMYFKYYHS